MDGNPPQPGNDADGDLSVSVNAGGFGERRAGPWIPDWLRFRLFVPDEPDGSWPASPVVGDILSVAGEADQAHGHGLRSLGMDIVDPDGLGDWRASPIPSGEWRGPILMVAGHCRHPTGLGLGFFHG